MLLARLEESIQTGNRALFDAVAEVLSRSEHPDIARTLARLAIDESVELPPAAGRWFGPVLAKSGLPDVADASKRRFEDAARAGRSWVSDSWLQAVAGAGDASDITWLLELPGRKGGIDAIARTANPYAVARFREAIWTDSTAANFVGYHLAANSDGWAWLLEVAKQATSGAATLPKGALTGILSRLAGLASPAQAGQLKLLLLGIRDPQQRLDALPAVEAIAQRGWDVADFDGLIQLPRVALEAIARGSEHTWEGIEAQTLIYAIEYNRVTWSEDAARALDAFAARHAHAKEVSEKVRAAISSHWKDR